jgi:hypothetical protein
MPEPRPKSPIIRLIADCNYREVVLTTRASTSIRLVQVGNLNGKESSWHMVLWLGWVR